MSDDANGAAPKSLNIDQAIQVVVNLYKEGRYFDAETICQKILEVDPAQPIVLHLLGLICRHLGKNDLAVELIQKALVYDPEYVDAYFNLGNSLIDQSKLDEAAECYQKAAILKPDFVDAHYNLGITFGLLNKQIEAESSYRKTLVLKPDFVEAHNNLGLTLQSLNKPEAAVVSFRNALALMPEFAQALNNLGISLNELNKQKEAVESYRKALSIIPDYTHAHNNLGIALNALNQLDDAIESYARALDLDPNFADAHFNLGVTLENQNKHDEAKASYKKAIAVDPNYAQAHWNLARFYLQYGDFALGWKEYEWGVQVEDARPHAQAQHLECAAWQGEPLQGKSILVYAEQGVGDEILFSNCIPDLLKQSPKQIYLECDPRLEALFARSFPDVQVCGIDREQDHSWVGDKAFLDFYIPIGSLPKIFRNHKDHFPAQKSFLIADTKKQAALRSDYIQMSHKKYLVGISWQSGNKTVGEERSIALAQLHPLLSNPNCQFINLQYGNVKAELSAYKAKSSHRIFSDTNINPLENLDTFSAQVAALDLVITIDNSTAHVAGALGVPAWVLLPYDANWRWQNAGDNSLWYSSVRLFRQSNPEDWDGLVEQVSKALTEQIAIV